MGENHFFHTRLSIYVFIHSAIVGRQTVGINFFQDNTSKNYPI